MFYCFFLCSYSILFSCVLFCATRFYSVLFRSVAFHSIPRVRLCYILFHSGLSDSVQFYCVLCVLARIDVPFYPLRLLNYSFVFPFYFAVLLHSVDLLFSISLLYFTLLFYSFLFCFSVFNMRSLLQTECIGYAH